MNHPLHAQSLDVAGGAATSRGPRVAVIIPCFNDGLLITETLASLEEAEPLEVVVVDDASTDPHTRHVLDRLKGDGVSVLRHETNQGLPAARTTGLRATRAPYVFPLDSDDLAVAGALAGLADCLDANPSAAVCFGDYVEFGTRDRLRRVPSRLDPYRVSYRNDYPVSSLFRRSALEATGGWHAVGDHVGYEDWHLWMALAEADAQGVHWGRGVALRRRLHGDRMLSVAGRQHVALYRTLRQLHPALFAARRRHRKNTDLGLLSRWGYPLVFGWRPPMSLESRTSRVLARIRLRRADSDASR